MIRYIQRNKDKNEHRCFIFVAACGLSLGEWALLFTAVRGLLIAVASPVVACGLQGTRSSVVVTCGLQELWLEGSRM